MDTALMDPPWLAPPASSLAMSRGGEVAYARAARQPHRTTRIPMPVLPLWGANHPPVREPKHEFGLGRLCVDTLHGNSDQCSSKLNNTQTTIDSTAMSLTPPACKQLLAGMDRAGKESVGVIREICCVKRK